MGRLIPDTRSDDIREIIVERHRVIYLVTDEVIAVLRVRHGAIPPVRLPVRSARAATPQPGAARCRLTMEA